MINANPNAILAFMDECHIQVQSTVARQWAPRGTEVRVKSRPGKNSQTITGVVIPETGELFIDKPGWFTYESVIASLRGFLTAYPPPKGKTYYIVLDNAPWHQKAIRLIWGEKLPDYGDIRASMHYVRMPPYSPDLNPIEQVWRVLRRQVTHNRYFADIKALNIALDRFFKEFKGPNIVLRTLCSFKCFAPTIHAILSFLLGTLCRIPALPVAYVTAQ